MSLFRKHTKTTVTHTLISPSGKTYELVRLHSYVFSLLIFVIVLAINAKILFSHGYAMATWEKQKCLIEDIDSSSHKRSGFSINCHGVSYYDSTYYLESIFSPRDVGDSIEAYIQPSTGDALVYARTKVIFHVVALSLFTFLLMNYLRATKPLSKDEFAKLPKIEL